MKGGSATSWGTIHRQGKGDTKEVKSDTRVLCSGPTQIQPMRGIL